MQHGLQARSVVTTGDGRWPGFPRGAGPAGMRVPGSPGDDGAWEKLRQKTRRSLPAVKVLGRFQRKGRGYGFTEFPDLRVAKGTFLILATSHSLW